MQKDIPIAECTASLDEIVKKWTYDIRGLKEVQTDERGKELIETATLGMREMYAHLRGVIAELEWSNMLLSEQVTYENDMAWDNQQLKKAIALKDFVIENDLEILKNIKASIEKERTQTTNKH